MHNSCMVILVMRVMGHDIYNDADRVDEYSNVSGG